MHRLFYSVLELLAAVVIVVVVADIAAPPHVATCALDESDVQFSIAVVASGKVGRRRDLDDALAAVADLSGCGGSS